MELLGFFDEPDSRVPKTVIHTRLSLAARQPTSNNSLVALERGMEAVILHRDLIYSSVWRWFGRGGRGALWSA